MNDLQRLVTDRANELGMSGREISKRAQQARMSLSFNTVSRVMRGTTTRPTEATIAGLAYALKLPPSQVREAADYPEDLGLYEPPECSRYLSYDQRRAVTMIIVQLAAVQVSANE